MVEKCTQKNAALFLQIHPKNQWWRWVWNPNFGSRDRHFIMRIRKAFTIHRNESKLICGNDFILVRFYSLSQPCIEIYARFFASVGTLYSDHMFIHKPNSSNGTANNNNNNNTAAAMKEHIDHFVSCVSSRAIASAVHIATAHTHRHRKTGREWERGRDSFLCVPYGKQQGNIPCDRPTKIENAKHCRHDFAEFASTHIQMTTTADFLLLRHTSARSLLFSIFINF